MSRRKKTTKVNSRTIKTFGGQKEVWPIKDKKTINRFMLYLLQERDDATSEVKRYQADRNWMMCLVGFNTAFRAEDLLQLLVSDVKKGYVSITENKTGKKQNYRMNKKLHADILEYIDRNNLNDYDYMFLGQKKQQNGKTYSYPITRQHALRVVKKAAKTIGINFPFGFHSLRKTFGYQFLADGGNPETLMLMLNHNDYNVTKRYTMWGFEDVQKERTARYIGGIHSRSVETNQKNES